MQITRSVMMETTKQHTCPDPYLNWDEPYGVDHIKWSLKRRHIGGNVKVIMISDNHNDLIDATSHVFIIEQPKNSWVTWLVSEEGEMGIAIPLSNRHEDYSTIVALQTSRIRDLLNVHVNNVSIIKVPECSDFRIESGQSAICNAQWLSASKKRGHPGGVAYVKIRQEDSKAWLLNGFNDCKNYD